MLLLFFLGLSLAQHDHSQHGHGSPMPQGRMSPVQVRLVSGWVRQVPSSLRDTTAYFVLQNPTDADLRLIGGESPVAQGVMLMEDHRENRAGQVVQGMREVKALVLPKGGRLELKPGGKHLMLMGLKRPLKEGERIPIRLFFEGSREARIELRVERR